MIRELLPPIDEEFWAAAREHCLLLQQCSSCGAYRFPPRLRCPRCGGATSGWAPASGRGRIISYVVVHQRLHPAFDSSLPYAVALVQLDEGPRMLAMLCEDEPSEVRVDAPVEVIFQSVDEELVIPRMKIVAA